METANLAPIVTSAAPAAEVPRLALSPVVPEPLSERVCHGRFDGAPWTYREGAQRLLSAVSRQAWAHPEQQGWLRVKHNATRDVWRAVIGGRAYYLKYYLTKPWLGALKRLFRAPPCTAEWDGGMYALREGIPAVVPEAFTHSLERAGRACALLVTAAVEPAYPLNEFWEGIRTDRDAGRRREDRLRLIDQLAEMIAKAHQAGFEHMDMHAANILVQVVGTRRYRTLFVDLHSSRLGTPISASAVVRNLAQLNQWFRRHSSISDRLRFLRAYFRWRYEYEHVFPHARRLALTFEQLVSALVRSAERHAWRLWCQRDRRLARSGRYFARVKLKAGWRGMVFLKSKQASVGSRASQLTLGAEWWRQQLRNPLRWFAEDASVPLKDSHSADVRRCVLEFDGQRLPVMVKRPRARNLRRRFSQLLRRSRAVRSWRMGHALLHRDVPTARPLAAIERRVGPFVLDSVLLTEGIPGAVDLETYLQREYAARGPLEWHRQKRVLARLLAKELRRFQSRGFVHRDCKASNLLIAPLPHPTLFWIDLDGVRMRRRLRRKDELAPLVRLHVSLLRCAGITRTDRARFLKDFLARFGVGHREWRSVWRQVEIRSQARLRRHQAHRAWKLRHYGRD